MTKYSFGAEAPFVLDISKKVAENYNKAMDLWFDAQRAYEATHGVKWDPAFDDLPIKMPNKLAKSWNKVANIVNSEIAKVGPLPAEFMLDDYLTKHIGSNTTGETLSRAGDISGLVGLVGGYKWGRGLTIAVGVGVLYGLLSGLEKTSDA